MKKIAVIGTGIAGMGTAWFLKEQYDITFYERNGYPGGHTNTVMVPEAERAIPVDTGFMVYNEVTYPNLTRLFNDLNVLVKPAPMSFSVQHIPTGLEYRGTGLNNLFCQRRNIVNIPFIRMLLEIDRFSKQADEVLTNSHFSGYTLKQYVTEKSYSDDFVMKFMVPMSSAVWSAPPDMMLEFPIYTIVRFFKNHGFLGLKTQHPWYTVDGGSRMYRERILAHFPGRVLIDRPVVKVIRSAKGVDVVDGQGSCTHYDYAVLACHADEALALLDCPSEREQNILNSFQYQYNRATLHTDTAVMPCIRKAWSAWNYRIGFDATGKIRTTTIYDMNILQQVSESQQYFVSINDPGLIDSEKIIKEIDYTHPIYSVDTLQAQNQVDSLNNDGPVYFAGSYFRYGFHEDALTSGVAVAEALSGACPDGYQGFDR